MTERFSGLPPAGLAFITGLAADNTHAFLFVLRAAGWAVTARSASGRMTTPLPWHDTG
jgi:hypothetical protein